MPNADGFPTSRRSYLATVSAGALGAGCLSSDEPPPGLDELHVYSLMETATTVSISVTRDGEEVYDDEHRFEPVEANVIHGGVRIEEPWLGEPVLYEIVVDATGPGRSTYGTSEFLEIAGSTSDIECFGLSVSVEPDVIDFLPYVSEHCDSG